MPLYTFRCLDCLNMEDIYLKIDETFSGSCSVCGGVVRKYYGNVRLAPSVTPTRSNIDFEATYSAEQMKIKDMAAYKRLCEEGLKPPAINGSANLETKAGTKHEINSGMLLKDNDRKRKEKALNDVLGSG